MRTVLNAASNFALGFRLRLVGGNAVPNLSPCRKFIVKLCFQPLQRLYHDLKEMLSALDETHLTIINYFQDISRLKGFPRVTASEFLCLLQCPPQTELMQFRKLSGDSLDGL